MLHTLQRFAVGILILSVVGLTFLAILSIWDVLKDDVFWKSLTTMSVIAFASAITLIAIRYLEDREKKSHGLM